jgi:N-acetylmuramic acid 6-phosphate etherase
MAASDGERTTRLDELATEAWNADGADLDLRSTRELVDLMNAEDATVPAAVAAAAPTIADAIDAVAKRLHGGGRLVYVGAGTSGRLAALDAVECETTFSTQPGQVVALIAGGAASRAGEQEAAEDDAEAGRHELEQLDVTAADAVVGVSASGRTPYVLGALEAARAAGALTVGVVCVQGSHLGALVEHELAAVVGPEILAGSTRLKAGTAQKLILNMISTLAMVRIGKTFGNLMVDVDATNEKLRARVRRILGHATGQPPDAIEVALAASGGDAKVAIVSLLSHTDAATARARLAGAHGVVRKALDA